MADANDADTRKRRRKARKRWNSESEDAGAPSKIKKSKAKGSQGSLVFQIGGDITDPLNLKTNDIPGVDDIDTKSKKSDRVVENVPPLQTDPLHLESEPKPILQRETSTGHRRRRKRISTCTQEPPPPPAEKTATKSSKNSRFRYGNYSRYYGYRGSSREQDERLGCMKKEWFADKDCLDIGCNIGHVTLCIGRDFEPKSIVGVDIDNSLISVAKKNVKHYLTSIRCVVNGEDVEIPASLVKSFGPLERYPPEIGQDKSGFPANVRFQAVSARIETVHPINRLILYAYSTLLAVFSCREIGFPRPTMNSRRFQLSMTSFFY